MTTDVQHCARCGENHLGLEFDKLARPILHFEWWCACPTNGDPILMEAKPDNIPPKWEIIPTKTEDHWLTIVDPLGWWKAGVKWDGCIHLDHAYNVPFPKTGTEDQDYLHICDLRDFISRMVGMLNAAKVHFGEHWPS